MTATTRADPLYRDPAASIPDRIADLLARMTVDERIAQLGSAWVFDIADLDGLSDDRSALLDHGIGHVTRLSGASSFGAVAAAELANEVQRFMLERTRLGIPAIVHEEICSGLMASQATVFAQAIGVASTFRPEYNRSIADAIRLQMRAIGAHHGLSPVLDICRDARWGRLEETYGEDPYLVSQMANEFIRGLQGDDADDLTDGVVATAKHFVGYGASEGGFNWAPAHLPERELRDVYLRPFEAAVRYAGLASVMNAYHELDGVPCGASRWLLTDVLRDEWGFAGNVVSDYFAVHQLESYHHVAESKAAAAALALRSGIDVELPSTDCYGDPLRQALDDGLVSMADVDLAVGRVLDSKFRLGLFDRPYVDTGAVGAHTRTDGQIALARQVARDSLVLLRNNGILPLREAASIAVIGPNAAVARNMLGDYSYPAHIESLLELLKSGRNVSAMPLDDSAGAEETTLANVGTVFDELRARMADTEVVHAPGCDVTRVDRSQFDAAVAAAASSTLAVLVMGDRSGLTDDCTTGESRDVSSLDLPGIQEDLVLAVAATGTPVVLVLVAGRPIGSPQVHEAAAAVLMAWLPGEQGAAAIVDALIGAVSPGGRLPVSYPRSSGQVPMFYGHKASGGRSHWKGEYVDLSNEPLYPFGHGMTYSSFELAVAAVAGRQVTSGDTVEVSVEVSNVGAVRADEVVQVYSRQPVASITRPVLELQAFVRITLDRGASARASFSIPVDALGCTGREMHYVLEPGRVELLIGSSSDDLQDAGYVVITGSEPIPTVRPPAAAVTVVPITPDTRQRAREPSVR